MQKTYVKDYLTHKTVKNTGQVQAYLLLKHHKPIIAKAEWERVQELLDAWRTRKKRRVRKVQKIVTVKRGRFAGYIIIDTSWAD